LRDADQAVEPSLLRAFSRPAALRSLEKELPHEFSQSVKHTLLLDHPGIARLSRLGRPARAFLEAMALECVRALLATCELSALAVDGTRSDHKNEPAQDGKTSAVPPSSARRDFADGAGWAGWDYPSSIESSTICPNSSRINHPAIDGIGFPTD